MNNESLNRMGWYVVKYTCLNVSVLLLLAAICFSSSYLPAGLMDYQNWWIARLSVVFAVCCLAVILLSKDKKQVVDSFHYGVIANLILLGGVEAVWGIRQLYGFASSNHSLFAVTGSFYNPGPYSGYLAMVFPLCLGEFLMLGKIEKRNRVEQFKYYLVFIIMLLILCVLPAGMSRSAWLAALVSGLWVYGMHHSWGNRLGHWVRRYRKRAVITSVVAVVLLIAGGTALFQLKANSANGRLLMWKVSCMAIAERPFAGYGNERFTEGYGRAQEKYFAAGDYSPKEELVAGSPEYAFNEYLNIAVEFGLPVLMVALLLIGFSLWKGITEKRISACGGILSFLVFGFSSYPMHIPGFAYAFAFLVAACIVGRSWIALTVFALIIGLSGTYRWKYNRYDACREWMNARVLYNANASEAAKKDYARLYPDLKDRGAFLFEYGHCLHKLKEYDASNRILKEAIIYTCDPMVLNIIGKNYHEKGEYTKAEQWLIRSTHRLPGRIYPYYLLARLYAEPQFHQDEKLRTTVDIVLTKEPKVQSTAVKQMREEVKKLIKSKENE